MKEPLLSKSQAKIIRDALAVSLDYGCASFVAAYPFKDDDSKFVEFDWKELVGSDRGDFSEIIIQVSSVKRAASPTLRRAKVELHDNLVAFEKAYDLPDMEF